MLFTLDLPVNKVISPFLNHRFPHMGSEILRGSHPHFQ